MSLSVANLLAEARRRIPVTEARLLLGHTLGRSAAWLEAHRDATVAVTSAGQYSALVGRRASGEPVAYLIGVREFYGRDFAVSPAVLIPRPETELLVDIAKAKVGAGPSQADASPLVGGGEPGLRAWGAIGVGAGNTAKWAPKILDLGTGSGCIAISLVLELPGARVIASDVSPAALAIARANAARLGAQVEFIESDWFAALPNVYFDLIVANPPYVAAGDPHLEEGDLCFEPMGALTDHADGLSAIREIITVAPPWLAPGGWLFFEHGYDQAEEVRDLLVAAGFSAIEQQLDLAGIVRASGGRYCISRE